MFKKVLYAGAIFCAVAAMTACGNKKAEEQTPATDSMEVVGVEVEDTVQQGDTTITAQEEVVAAAPVENAEAQKDAAAPAAPADKDAKAEAATTAK